MSSVFDFLGDNVLSLFGGLGSVLGVFISYAANKYIAPLLQVEKNRRYANWISAIADEVTDDLRLKYPNNRWLEELDRAVDKIIDICGIERDVADRAIRAAAGRKQ
ncbi:MAG: hypothetical protein R3F48_15100 [Candidatus Zixiibacteriota bacterium]